MLSLVLLSVALAVVTASPPPYAPAAAPYAGVHHPGFPHFGGYYGGVHPYFYNGFPYTYNGFPYNYNGQYAAYPGHQAPAYPTGAAPAPHAPTSYGADLKYMGEFDGTCESKSDGLYYVDERSFAYCSGGYKSIQSCAEGSENPPVHDFSAGKYTHYYDFCSINVQATIH